ncbi:M60 family metallopeptidase [Parabacteroides sp. OttesenSCG-928-G06]|nr:M60 family metallopeptidase [Parabacteroides sp. OttesenSCG-928-G06]
MKKKNLYLLFLLFFLTMTACSDKEDEPDPLLETAVDNVDFTNQAGSQTVGIRTNVAGWIAEVDANGKEWCSVHIQEAAISISVSENPLKGLRETSVRITGGVITKKVDIRQVGSAYAGGNLNLKEDIKVKIAGGKASSFQPGEDIEKSFDGNFQTLYHSNWSNGTTETNPNYFPITLDYYFDNAPQIDYLVYYPRQTGSNGFFKQTEIWVSTANTTEFTKVMDKDFQGSSVAGRVDFPEPLTGVKAIRLVVKSGAGDRQGFASCAEMEFYRKNQENFDPSSLFLDLACSQLKPGITEAEIDACPDEFFRNMARFMFYDNYPRDFRIATYKAYPHPDMESSANKTGKYSLHDNPTGIVAERGRDLVVLVGDIQGYSVGLRIVNFHAPGGDGFYDAKSYPLAKGVNCIKPEEGGLVYLMYHTPDFKTAPAIPVHFASGEVNGYFDLARHSAEDWKEILDNATHDYLDVVGKYAHLTFPTARFRAHTGNRGKELIEAYDRIVDLEHEFMGLKKYDCRFNNRMYFSVIYTSYMYAAAYHTGYHDGTLSELCDVDALKTTAIWGPAHEVGHINQTYPGLKWIGTTEVTNNIFSMYVQREMGNPTRLQTESMSGEGGYTNRYEKAMNRTFRTGQAHAAEEDVFCKLVPFWQLQLYLADAQGNQDFYKDLYQIVRQEPDKQTHGANQVEFVVRASKAAKLNLCDFFEKWGFLTLFDREIEDYSKGQLTVTKSMVDDAKRRIEEMGYPKPTHRFEYICDANKALYKPGAGTITKGTAFHSGRKLTLSGWTNVVAYEVRQGDKLIFVSSESSFTLDNSIPNWKNDYQVFAISAKGEEVKVDF